MSSEARVVQIREEVDIVSARAAAREQATTAGFRPADATAVVTAVSEVARNILTYAGQGQVTIELIENDRGKSLCVTATDEGPGIPDIELAMRDGYSTIRSLGLGLPGCRRLMDEFSIASEVGRGTTVQMVKRISR